MSSQIFPTHVPDVDREILYNLSDDHLDSVCVANQYLSSLCNGPAGVWRRKFADQYVDLGSRYDYVTLYRKMKRYTSTDWYRWSPARLVTYIVQLDNDRLFDWVLNKRMDIHLYLDPLMEQKRLRLIVRLIERLNSQDKLNDELIYLMFDRSASYNALEIFNYLFDRFQIKLTHRIAKALTDSARGHDFDVFISLWPQRDKTNDQQLLDHLIRAGEIHVIYYTVTHGLSSGSDLIGRLLTNAVSWSHYLNADETPRIFHQLLEVTPLSEEDLQKLFISYVNQPLRYVYPHQAPAITLAEYLSDRFLQESDYIRGLVKNHMELLFVYLVDERRLKLSISVDLMIQSDAAEIFGLWFDRLTTKQKIALGLTHLDDLLSTAIVKGAEHLINKILTAYPTLTRRSEYSLVKEAFIARRFPIAVYLLTESPFVSNNNYGLQYDLFDRVVDALDGEGLIREQFASLVLEAMHHYEEHGYPYDSDSD